MCLSVVVWARGPDAARGRVAPLAGQDGPLWWRQGRGLSLLLLSPGPRQPALGPPLGRGGARTGPWPRGLGPHHCPRKHAPALAPCPQAWEGRVPALPQTGPAGGGGAACSSAAGPCSRPPEAGLSLSAARHRVWSPPSAWPLAAPLTFHEEPVHVGALAGRGGHVLPVLLGHLHGQTHPVQRPLVLPGHGLHDGREEGLRVEEARQPHGGGQGEVRRPGL